MFGIFKKSDKVELYSPISGKSIPIEQTPDQVFSEKIAGDGIAINPEEGLVVSPCKGEILQIFKTNHAIAIKEENGLEILVHLGVDTVNLEGKGFERIAEVGQKVKVGDPLIKMDLEFLKENAKSIICPIIITNMDKVGNIERNYGNLKRGQRITKITLKK
ncbi:MULTISPECIES: PTS sugar transporter subunit IIA [Oceanotoga]|jgi:glucose-specific phosphotransferase system IIA component|uniref:PTS system D-glucosamine-specific IIA component/PTS system glucose-specific IIA component n=1 Tax=Oceanotoga teriensis TaxID=515440 RepID=A0AA45HJ27_9BACT|nr:MULTISPECIES: PTS glucose transporter subunit IIA [Oceanotoga]MDN5342513.1 sugar system component [Oceanotoga sp.]MDO7977487.1 PTS glucose transporter subunit IIA [Oceanotoga teriensis]PWJ95648.1 PTS system D-glucosamine-specific IIA component/PTS system glucose-specific IIA component [Oceanotoga teriensis]